MIGFNLLITFLTGANYKQSMPVYVDAQPDLDLLLIFCCLSWITRGLVKEEYFMKILICFYGEIRKIIPKLLLNTPP